MANPLEILGQRIAELRKASGQTQKEFGESLGVTAGAVSQWEGGKIDLPYSTQVRIAAALRVSVAALSEATIPIPAPLPAGAVDADRLAVISFVLTCPDARVKTLKALIDSGAGNERKNPSSAG